MLKLLIKKQLTEIFRNYFYDAKNNTRRTKKSTVVLFAAYAFIMVGVLGVSFTFLASMICKTLTDVALGWFYFAIMGVISIALGAFGSVFSTYSGLYLSKDNDLLLSLPIPVGIIIASRLASVYIIGLLYSAVASIPAAIVYLINSFTFSTLITSILMIFVISIFVALLSCILGWVVAKISLKIKHKSLVTVIVSLLFIAIYYFVYFKAGSLLTDFASYAVDYGEKIKGKFYPLYLFGRASEGDIFAFVICVLAVGIAAGLVWLILSKSFVNIATSTGSSEKVKTKFKHSKQHGIGTALLRAECSKFLSSANYILNCGMGTLMLIIASIAMLIFRNNVIDFLNNAFSGIGTKSGLDNTALMCFAVCIIAAMNTVAVPSLSLEGKSLWIKQSLPITGRQVLFAKLKFHFLLTVIPSLICDAVIIYCIQPNIPLAILTVFYIIIYSLFLASFSLFLGMRRPNFTWTNELMPIKQSISVAIALFGGFGISAIALMNYISIGNKMALGNSYVPTDLPLEYEVPISYGDNSQFACQYMLTLGIIFAILAGVIIFYLMKKDSKKFSEL